MPRFAAAAAALVQATAATRRDVSDGKVTFRYKDYADGQRSKTMTVSGEEFLRRFLTHVLPRGFVKVRHYGLLANRRREEKLTACRRLLFALTAISVAAEPGQDAAKTDGVATDPAAAQRCPKCGGCRFTRFELPAEAQRDTGSSDTS